MNIEKTMGNYLVPDKSKIEKEKFIKKFRREVGAQLYPEEMEQFVSNLYDMDDDTYDIWRDYLVKREYKYVLRGIKYILPFTEQGNTQHYEKGCIIVEMGVRENKYINNAIKNIRLYLSNDNNINNIKLEKAKVENGTSEYLKLAQDAFEELYGDFKTPEIKEYYELLYSSIPSDMLRKIDKILDKCDTKEEEHKEYKFNSIAKEERIRRNKHRH